MPRTLHLSLALLLAAAITPVMAQTAHLEGQVVTPEGAPVAKAIVQIRDANGPPGQPPNRARTYVEVASSDGRFALDLQPGTYVATAAQIGYSSMPDDRAPRVVLGPGDSQRDVKILLTVLGRISGSVTDLDGDPVSGAQVRLLRYVFSAGRMQLTNLTVASADDHGQFHLPNLLPGRYLLRATVNNPIANLPPNVIRGASALESNRPTFYPSASNESGATPVQVGSLPIENLQIRMQRGRGYSIHGKVEGAFQGRQPSFLVSKKGEAGVMSTGVTIRSDGVFEARDLTPGDYILVARWNSPNKDEPGRGGRREVTITNSDVDNVTVPLEELLHVTGRLRTADGADWAGFVATRGKPTVLPANRNSPGEQVVRPAAVSVGLGWAEEGTNFGSPRTVVKADGTFTVDNTAPGRYTLQVGGIPDGSAIQSVRFGGQDVTHQALNLRFGGELEVVITPAAGKLQAAWPPGLASGDRPKSTATAYAWPAEPDQLLADGGIAAIPLTAAGPVTFSKLSDGNYFIAAFEELPAADAMRIPAFLARFNDLATRFTIRDGEQVSVSPAVIPAATIQQIWREFP